MSMLPYSLKEIALACNGRLFGDSSLHDAPITGVVSDSRKVKNGNLFLCIKGATFDGHDFAEKAYELGALCCLCERPLNTDKPYILVPSVTDAIRSIAARYRDKLSIPIVGIIGSVGKTTAKEMTAAVLSRKYSVLKTQANLNNELGVPLTVLSIENTHTAAVIEMGISDFGEMTRLAEIVRPDICVFTTVGYCHLENLNDLDGVLKAKSEVFPFMPKTGVAVLNGDDEKLRTFDPKIKKLTYGLSAGCDYTADSVLNSGFDGVDCKIHHDSSEFSAHINGFGTHIVSAALAGSAVGHTLGISDSDIALGINDYRTVGGRANVTDTGYLTVIDDCYNANPNSVRAAIDSLTAISGRTVAILGDMLELGDTTNELHRSIGEYAGEKNIDVLLCNGPIAKNIYEGYISAKSDGIAKHFDDKSELIAALGELLHSGDTVLVKASHGMHFEEIVSAIKSLGEAK